MPMNFPDMESLCQCAKINKFRQPNENESELQYRIALADHVEPIDFVESCEIRNKVGWDKFTDRQNITMLERKIGSGALFDIFTKLESSVKKS